MKISIITVVLNNRKTIADTIMSVLSQTYKNIEYIVIDGASTDGTIKVIRQFEDKIAVFVSAPDGGIYAAMNKGIKLATGDVVGLLNGDDFYRDNKVIAKVAQVFKSQKTDCLFADLVYVRANNLKKVVRYYDSSTFSPDKFAYGQMPAHPTFFVKRQVYKNYGLFSTDFKIFADFDILARFLYVHKISYYYLKEPLVVMRTGGVSTSIGSIWTNNKEALKACKNNGIKTNIFKILSRYPQKIMGLLH